MIILTVTHPSMNLPKEALITKKHKFYENPFQGHRHFFNSVFYLKRMILMPKETSAHRSLPVWVRHWFKIHRYIIIFGEYTSTLWVKIKWNCIRIHDNLEYWSVLQSVSRINKFRNWKPICCSPQITKHLIYSIKISWLKKKIVCAGLH